MIKSRGGVNISFLRLATLILWITVSFVLLTACGSDPTPTVVPPTRTPKPTFTIVVHTPTPEPSPTPLATATPVPSPTPTANPYLNPLTGQMVEDPAVLQRRPLLVRIGNDAQVRPQYGLSEADMVYEEAMDGWTLTRLTAIVWSKDPDVLRPIRSARLFTIQLGYMFDGALVHSGANDQVRWILSQSTLTDLDEFFHGAPYHWLDPEGAWKDYPWMGRVATSAQRVRDYMAAKDMDQAVQLPGFAFSEDPPEGEAATYILIPYPSRSVVEWEYETESGGYRRVVEGVPHTDALNGQQLVADNVIVHYAEYQETDVLDVNGAPTLNIVSTGEGRAQIFRDGTMIEAKWIRPEREDFCQYVYLDGSPVPLRPGQTWVAVVPLEYKITHN